MALPTITAIGCGEAKEADREQLAHVYADRHLVAAYTDRPTYRPGQEVQFKLIVRRLVPEKEDAARFGKSCVLFFARPTSISTREWSCRRRAVGSRTLCSIPTADRSPTVRWSSTTTAPPRASSSLNAETATGPYSLRVHVGGLDRVVPEVFAVQYYRRPTFELQVAGVPEKLKKPRDLTLELTGGYYFGKPVAGGRVTARLVRTDAWRPLARADDDAGRRRQGRSWSWSCPSVWRRARTSSSARLPTTAAERSAESLPLELEGPPAQAGKGLDRAAALPAVRSAVRGLHAGTGHRRRADRRRSARLRDGEGRGNHQAAASRLVHLEGRQRGGRAVRVRRHAAPVPHGWAGGTGMGQPHRLSRPGRRPARTRGERDGQQLLALFDRQHVAVGDRLRVLVYAPYQRARLLFTIEGRTVVDYFITWTPAGDGHYHVIEIPIKERYLPNFYLQGRILTGERATQVPSSDSSVSREARNELERLRDDEGEDPRWCRIDVLDSESRPRRGKAEGRGEDHSPGVSAGRQGRCAAQGDGPAGQAARGRGVARRRR